jgi:hypothetical protein
MMRGASLSDIAWIINFNKLRDQVFIYNHSERSAERVEDLEWPLVWLLAAPRMSSTHPGYQTDCQGSTYFD